MEIKILEREREGEHIVQKQAILLSTINVLIRFMQQPLALKKHITCNPLR